MDFPSRGVPLSKEYKVGKVKQTSWLNISKLLIEFRGVLKDKGLLIEKQFDYKLIDLTNAKGHAYEGINFENIIFCEGANVVKNPFFKHLPFSLNKGQLITINSEKLELKSILKKQVFVLPIGSKQFKIGATYSWKWENEKPESDKTESLKKQLSDMLNVPYKIVEAVAGLRPAVKDRRPLIGRHKHYENYYIFNGMG